MYKEILCLQWCFINALVIIICMFTVSAPFDITVPFFVFAPPNENTFRRPWHYVNKYAETGASHRTETFEMISLASN